MLKSVWETTCTKCLSNIVVSNKYVKNTFSFYHKMFCLIFNIIFQVKIYSVGITKLLSKLIKII